MKYKAKVLVEYSFEFETDKKTRNEIQEEAEKIWEQFTDFGLEESKYKETHIDYDKIQ